MNTAENPWLRMALNNAWANATIFSAIKELPEGTFGAPAPGFFPSLQKTMNHIYEVDLYYLDALEGGGKGGSVFERFEISDPATLAAAQADADMRLASFCSEIDQTKLDTYCVTERLDGPIKEQVAAVLLHLIQHQIHHRGQAHVQLQAVGAVPPQLDDFYLEYGRVPSAAAYWS